MYKIFLSALSFLFVCDIAMAQTAVSEPDYSIPVKITPYLIGNFGELRPNHFHAGIDFKTQGSVVYSIYIIEDGRVARIVVLPRAFV